MSNLEPLRKIIEEIKNMTPEQEEQFKKDIEKLAEKYKSEDYNYDDIDIILPNEAIAELTEEHEKENEKSDLLEKIKRGEVLTSEDLNSINGIEFDGLENLTEDNDWFNQK